MDIDYYDKNAQSFFNETVSVNLEDIYHPFFSHLENGAHILDAGCGSGRDTKAFLERGYRVTAFDSSKELVKMAAKHTRQKVVLMNFNEIHETEIYDGIWCCASLLHMSADKLLDSMVLLERALKKKGVFYASFKYGSGERYESIRQFTDMDEPSFNEFATQLKYLVMIKTWITYDKRPEREEKWLNVLLKKS